MESNMIASAQYQVSEIELIYKSKTKASSRPKVTESKDAYNILNQDWDKNKIDFIEQFKVLLLNRANKVLAIYEVSSGGITSTIADPRMIFAAALKANAVSMVLAHNHPSGNLKPSRADEDLTLRMKQAGIYLDIKVMDHIVLSSEGYFSFADEGLL